MDKNFWLKSSNKVSFRKTMETKASPFAETLIAAINAHEHKNIRTLVEQNVLNKCINNGFLTTEDRDEKNKLYRWVLLVLDNDHSAIRLFRNNSFKVITESDYKRLLKEIDEIADIIIEDIAKRVINREIEQPF